MNDSQDRDQMSKPELIALLIALGQWLLPNLSWVAIITVVLLIIIGVYGFGNNRKNETNLEPSSWTTIFTTASLSARRLVDNVINFFTPSATTRPYPQQELRGGRLSQFPLAIFLIFWGVTWNKYLYGDFYDYRLLILPIALLVILVTIKKQAFVSNRYFRFFFVVSLFPTVTFSNDILVYSPIVAGLILVYFTLFFDDRKTFNAPVTSWFLAIHILTICIVYILKLNNFFDLLFLMPFVTGLGTAFMFYKRM
ncbi:MAG: hypothetical protein IPM31_13275 [Anaerolineae bacterium]|nr:hypothetical protein [Anaerolineae bacterium]MBL8106130.1 hypothetical protein [Anaerolineales bacterium]MCC7189283.1 hypothetical protein [Anaerolineales bacterium]